MCFDKVLMVTYNFKDQRILKGVRNIYKLADKLYYFIIFCYFLIYFIFILNRKLKELLKDCQNMAELPDRA